MDMGHAPEGGDREVLEWWLPLEVALSTYRPAASGYPLRVVPTDPTDAGDATGDGSVGEWFQQAWKDAVETYLALPADADVIATLREQLRTQGRFRRPIRVDEETSRVCDGMHRMIALILENHARVHLTTASTIEHDTDMVDVEVTVTVTHDPLADLDAANDAVVEWAWSFPMQDAWINTDVATGSDGSTSLYYYCPAWLRDELADAVKARVEGHTPYRVDVSTADVTLLDVDG